MIGRLGFLVVREIGSSVVLKVNCSVLEPIPVEPMLAVSLVGVVLMLSELLDLSRIVSISLLSLWNLSPLLA